MGILTRAKIKSINPDHFPEYWKFYSDDDFILVKGKLVLKPMVHKKSIKRLIFMEYGKL